MSAKSAVPFIPMEYFKVNSPAVWEGTAIPPPFPNQSVSCFMTLRARRGISVVFHEVPDGFLQAVQGELEHGEDHADGLEGADVVPLHLHPGVEPGGVAEVLGQAAE